VGACCVQLIDACGRCCGRFGNCLAQQTADISTSAPLDFRMNLKRFDLDHLNAAIRDAGVWWKKLTGSHAPPGPLHKGVFHRITWSCPLK
ncbi:hypothetical protein QYM36_019737, partial [Artemia franciscana]